MTGDQTRQKWGSRWGVILAVAGSAIGLGNFLRFPGIVANNGGGAFMIPYFVSLFVLGLPLMWIEWTIGRFGGGFGHSTAPGIFQSMWSKSKFIKYFGVIGIFGPVIIFAYYAYIESWLLGYSFYAALGRYNAARDFSAMGAFLNGYRGLVKNEFFQGLGPAYTFFLITFVLNIGIVFFGIQKGIERVCKIALPVLLLLAIVLVVRVFTLGAPDPAHPENSVIQGLNFLWTPDWSKLADARVWLAAAGQIFFTLSVGIGVILTYASYLRKQDDVVLSGLTAATANEFAEVILGGSLVIPAAVAFFGVEFTRGITAGDSSTFDLACKTMPLVLQRIPLGQLFGVAWFLLLFLAGITSSISLIQPAVAFLEDEFDLDRREAITVFSVVSFGLCNMAILGLGHGVVDEMDFWGGSFCLVLFGAIEVILFAWVFGMQRAWTELHTGSDLRLPRFYGFVIKYVTPLFLLTILGSWLVQKWDSEILMRRYAGEELTWRLVTRIGMLMFFALLSTMVWIAWKRKPQAGERA